ncbi:MAG: hypothetical protein HY049_14370 [Acidobacteria bacterium]|nr:hypothetical protein [Acidobacteriota bacterium]
MRCLRLIAVTLSLLAGLSSQAASPASPAAPAVARAPRSLPLDSVEGVKAFNVKPEIASYKGRRAIHLLDKPVEGSSRGGGALVILPETEFKDGTIEIEVAGAPREGAAEGARGFIGVAFRVKPDGSKYECFYLRPTNGRADDQLRRNHSTQYISEPGFPWELLRKDAPGIYESYVDLEAGAWTRMKIVVEGVKAKLFVNGSDQPVLIVSDLKQGETSGAIALWTGLDTDGYFSSLTIR